MSSRTLATLRADATQRSYHVLLKGLTFVPLAVYTLVFITSHHAESTSETDGGGKDKVDKVAEAKDGLRIRLRSPDESLPEWKLAMHSFAAMGLLAACVLQKETVVWMARGAREYAAWIRTHRWVGRIALGMVVAMDAGGFLMAPHAGLEHFDTFIYLFAAPFAVFGVGLYVTATPEYLDWHRLFANMLVKGCIGTPLARWAGALLQRNGWDIGPGYYVGIGGVTVVLGVWQLVELVEFARTRSGVVPALPVDVPVNALNANADDVVQNHAVSKKLE